MATYIVLGKLTDQGIRNAKSLSENLRRGEQLAAQRGIKLVDFYLTMGEYDAFVVLDAPSDEAVTQHVLSLGMQGNVRTTTLKAFPRAEAEKLVQSLG